MFRCLMEASYSHEGLKRPRMGEGSARKKAVAQTMTGMKARIARVIVVTLLLVTSSVLLPLHSAQALSCAVFNVTNLTALTGSTVVSAVTSWQTPNGPYNVEHLAGQAPNGDLLTYYWQSDGLDWRVVNVSQITGQKISGTVTNWQTPNGPYNVEHLAGQSPTGDLLVFYWQPDGLDWRVINVSQITGRKITGAVTSWQTPNGPYTVEHLAGQSPEGDLLVFYWQPDGLDWRVVNVSQITGRKVASALIDWQTPNGPYNVEHLAGQSPEGDLLVFYWQPDGLDWRVINVSQITGQKITGAVTNWQTPNGSYTVEHLAGQSPNSDLLVFYWQPDGLDWRVINVSQITGRKVAGVPTLYQLASTQGNVEVLSVKGSNGALLYFWWTSARIGRSLTSRKSAAIRFSPIP